MLDAELDFSSPGYLPPPPKRKEEVAEEPEEDFFIAVEKMPELLNGMKDIQERINYPEMAKKAKDANNQEPDALDESGTWFKVQVGAFENIDMSEYFKNNPNFSGEQTEEGLQRITLGRFRDYWEADRFKKTLRKMGVKEAWIVPYKEGVRVPLKEVLENLSAKPADAGQ
jgi:cell division protein FtsN